MQNIYPNLKIKMLHEIKKIFIFFPGFSCMHRHMCIHKCYIPGSRNCLQVSGPSFIQVTFCCWQRTAEANFFVYFWRKRGFASISNNWQLLHRRPALRLNISTPLTFCAFSKLTPQNQASKKIVPLPPSKPQISYKIAWIISAVITHLIKKC